MRARRLTPADLASLTSDDLVGAVLLAPITLSTGQIRKGSRLDRFQAGALLEERPEVRLAWPEPGDLPEDEAAARLAGPRRVKV